MAWNGLVSSASATGTTTFSTCSLGQKSADSLGRAIAEVPGEMGFESAAQFRVVVEGSQRRLNPWLSGEVYHVVREAIVNAYRHSGAKDIEAEIRYLPGELRISVRDNGSGINPREIQWEVETHSGLRAMRECADRIGARLRVSTAFALGTEVELRVPGRLAFECAASAWA